MVGMTRALWLLAAVLSIGLAGLSACSPSSGEGPASSPPSTSATGSPAPSVETNTTTSPQEDPRTIEAKGALECAYEKLDAAYAQPQVDSYVSLRECIADPFLTSTINTLAQLAQKGIYEQGTTTREIVDSAVIAESPYEVEFTVCTDQSASVFVKADGQKLPEADVGPRTLAKMTVLDYGPGEGLGYLVYKWTAIEPVTPC